MSDNYFRLVRSEIENLLPATASHVVDIGCGAGATSKWLKSKYPSARFTGVEVNAAYERELSNIFDKVYIGDLNTLQIDVAGADLVMFLDVLEHLANPDKILESVVRQLAPNATVIVSLPNVAHLSVSLPLFFKGQFQYRDAGILDRTHLHFYVRDSAVDLLNKAGLNVQRGLESGMQGPKARLLNTLTFGLLRDRLSKQYIMAGAPRGAQAAQPPIPWTVLQAMAPPPR